MSWIGKRMMNPEGKIGKVVLDVNGIFRILTVEFDDKTEEELWLANMGPNPERSRKWKWEFERENIRKWVEWRK